MERGRISFEHLEAVARALQAVTGVESARVWAGVPGKERVYVRLRSLNGGKSWHGGASATLALDAAANELALDRNGWAGAATRKGHEENGTLAKVRAAIDTVDLRRGYDGLSASCACNGAKTPLRPASPSPPFACHTPPKSPFSPKCCAASFESWPALCYICSRG